MRPLVVTDTSEKGLETLIMRHMTGTEGLAAAKMVSIHQGGEMGVGLRRVTLGLLRLLGIGPKRVRLGLALLDRFLEVGQPIPVELDLTSQGRAPAP